MTGRGWRVAPLVVAAALTLAGCGKSSSRTGAAAGSGTLRDGLYYMEPGAPDPLACRGDDDCVADVVVQADGCCFVNNPYAQSRAWRDWLQARRRTGVCDQVDCSTETRMAPPPSCATEVHCVAGRCADSCQ